MNRTHKPHVGFAVREQNRPIHGDSALTALEITYERANDPLLRDRYLGDAEPEYVSVHALKISPATPDLPREEYLRGILETARANGAVSISDHLGFTRTSDSGIDLGHFCLPPQTDEALAHVVKNTRMIMKYFRDYHFFLENIAYLFKPGRWTMSESEFISRLLAETGCGLLLDITNVHANAVNHGYNAIDFIQSVIPHASRLQMHLAGGFIDDNGVYIDSHSEPIPEEVWDLFRHALRLAGDRVDAVFIERDQNFPDMAGWREELHTAAQFIASVNGEPEFSRT